MYVCVRGEDSHHSAATNIVSRHIGHFKTDALYNRCGLRHERYRVFNVAPNQMDRDNVTAMETDKIVDDDIGNPQVSTYWRTCIQ